MGYTQFQRSIFFDGAGGRTLFPSILNLATTFAFEYLNKYSARQRKRARVNTAYANADFVHNAVADLVKWRCAEEIAEQPYVSSPLSVVENSKGKKKLVVNLRHINQFLWKRKFKYEDLRIAMMLFSPGELMFNCDLKFGYRHVEIAVPWFRMGTEFVCFSVLTFGLASAPYVFTKLCAPW